MLGSGVTLPSDQEIPDSIFGSVVRFFTNGKLFHSMYGLRFFCVLSPYSVLCCLRNRVFTLLITGQGRPSNCACVPKSGQ